MIENEILSLSDREICNRFPKEQEINENPWKENFKEGDLVIYRSNNLLGTDLKSIKGNICSYVKVQKVIKIFNDTKQVLVLGSKESFLSYSRDFRKLYYEEVLSLKESLLFHNLYPKTVTGKLRYLKKAIEAIIPENNYEIKLRDFLFNYDEIIFNRSKFDSYSDLDVIVTIYYPEIHITNELGLEHTIKDVYVKFVFRILNYGIKLDNFYITRATVFTKEYKSDGEGFYIHSHSRRGLPGEWLGFCLGSSPYNTLYNKLYETRPHSIMDLQNLFFGLESILSWESIAGTPYNYISGIGDLNYINILESSITSQFLKEVRVRKEDRDFLYSLLKEFTYNICKEDITRPIKIIVSEEVRNEFFKYLVQRYSITSDKLCLNSLGNYKQINKNGMSTRFRDSVDNKFLFNFNGKRVMSSIIDDNVDQEYNDVNPVYLQATLLPLETEFFKYLTQKQNDDNY